jgi:hypothetical protein
MIWPWKREARLIEPRRAANTSVLELETAKEILAEVFRARPADVEEMIQKRLEERDWGEQERPWPPICRLSLPKCPHESPIYAL